MKISGTHFTASLAVGLLGIASLALAGCTGPAATACDVVTEQDASTALGSDPGAGVAVTAAGASSCTFGHYPSLVTVNLIVQGGKADLAHIRSADTTNSLTDIPGIGDSAFGVSKGPVASVWFSSGDTMVAIVVVGGTSGGPFLDQAKAVATAALSRL